MSARKIFNVLQVSRNLGIGGTEKTLQLFSEYLNKNVFTVIVCAWDKGGIRGDYLKSLGFKVIYIHNNLRELVSLMRNEKIDIVHIHRSGLNEPLVIQAARIAGVPVIVETNVFGFIDESRWEKYIDCHLFVSKFCAVRYKYWRGLPWEEFFQRHRVLYNPIDLSTIDSYHLTRDKTKELRKQYGIPSDAPVIGRVGRPDPAKWSPLGKVLEKIFKRIPEARFIAKGAPMPIIDDIQKRRALRNKVIFLPPSPEERKVIEFYSIVDVFIHSARIGESFGLVIAEAMACGKPVVSKSTPLRDNAQVELIDHGQNGCIVYYANSFADATVDLLLNDEKRSQMGRAARKKVEYNYNVKMLTLQLEKLYIELLERKGINVDPSLKSLYKLIPIIPSFEEIQKFEQEYKRRLRTCWGKPNYLEIWGYEHLLKYSKIQKCVRTIKRIVH